MISAQNYTMIIILAVFFVLMIVMTIIPQRKQKKKREEMMAKLGVGSKIMTIGRLVGYVVSFDEANNTAVINVGTEENATYITIDRAAIGIVLESATVEAQPAGTTISEPEFTGVVSDEAVQEVFELSDSEEVVTEEATVEEVATEEVAIEETVEEETETTDAE